MKENNQNCYSLVSKFGKKEDLEIKKFESKLGRKQMQTKTNFFDKEKSNFSDINISKAMMKNSLLSKNTKKVKNSVVINSQLEKPHTELKVKNFTKKSNYSSNCSKNTNQNDFFQNFLFESNSIFNSLVQVSKKELDNLYRKQIEKNIPPLVIKRYFGSIANYKNTEPLFSSDLSEYELSNKIPCKKSQKKTSTKKETGTMTDEQNVQFISDAMQNFGIDIFLYEQFFDKKINYDAILKKKQKPNLKDQQKFKKITGNRNKNWQKKPRHDIHKLHKDTNINSRTFDCMTPTIFHPQNIEFANLEKRIPTQDEYNVDREIKGFFIKQRNPSKTVHRISKISEKKQNKSMSQLNSKPEAHQGNKPTKNLEFLNPSNLGDKKYITSNDDFLLEFSASPNKISKTSNNINSSINADPQIHMNFFKNKMIKKSQEFSIQSKNERKNSLMNTFYLYSFKDDITSRNHTNTDNGDFELVQMHSKTLEDLSNIDWSKSFETAEKSNQLKVVDKPQLIEEIDVQ